MGILRQSAARAVNLPCGLFGLQVTRRDRLYEALSSYGVNTVLDVGAHTGQFALAVRRALPDAMVHSFEPSGETFFELRRSCRADPGIRTWQLALSEEEGVVSMYRNEASATSSLLPMTALSQRAFPHATKWRPEMVTATTLDKWAATQSLVEPILIKVDVQGYEAQVLRGGTQTFGRALVLLLEVSFAELYEGQSLFDDIYTLIRGLNFSCCGMFNNIYDPHSHGVLQSDALFVRSAAPR
jgi:FkbM family methyltransferase